MIEHFPFDAGQSRRQAPASTILESLPRDELFQASVSDLVRCLRPVLPLEARSRVRLILRRDEFQRFWSCLVFVPRERLMRRAQARIEASAARRTARPGLDARACRSATHPSRSCMSWCASIRRASRDRDAERLEREIAAALVSGAIACATALGSRFGAAHARSSSSGATAAASRPLIAQDVDAQLAVDDIEDLESSGRSAPEQMQLRLYRPASSRASGVHLRILRRGETLSVSEVLPTFEHFDLRVIAERPYRSRLADGSAAWIQDFELEHFALHELAVQRIAAELIAAFRAVRAGELDDDGFNRLLIACRAAARGRSWCCAPVAAICCRPGITFSQSYMERVLAAHAAHRARAGGAVRASAAPRAPRAPRRSRAARLEQRVRRAIGDVSSADEDRILRAFLAVVLATLAHQLLSGAMPPASRAPSCRSSSTRRAFRACPQPRPAFEIFVHSPRVEGVHLRKGPIARGGIRWSERPDDFRTEILGLMKAQHVKNTLIVPVGAKGGFVVRRLPPRAPRDARAARSASSATAPSSRALLDLTDNIVDGRSRARRRQVRRLDGDDPYLVVAADKGTASFSDIANAISAEHRLLARRCLRLGRLGRLRPQEDGHHGARRLGVRQAPFSRARASTPSASRSRVVGIGDMSGDVFGNGLLLSRAAAAASPPSTTSTSSSTRIPIRQRSYRERERLFRAAALELERLSTARCCRAAAASTSAAPSAHAVARGAARCSGCRQRRATPTEVDARHPVPAGRPAVERRHRHLREGHERAPRRDRRPRQRRGARQRPRPARTRGRRRRQPRLLAAWPHRIRAARRPHQYRFHRQLRRRQYLRRRGQPEDPAGCHGRRAGAAHAPQSSAGRLHR